ncbi:hypothetical protein GCM10010170_037950 [Dactylosporangium salmoneum]|uniref:Uncharacterized protein n=1 Tax=Dactylosporangium salmoneum TaxID=53361 RepID=A0ABN3GDN6_9ACTN
MAPASRVVPSHARARRRCVRAECGMTVAFLTASADAAAIGVAARVPRGHASGSGKLADRTDIDKQR